MAYSNGPIEKNVNAFSYTTAIFILGLILLVGKYLLEPVLLNMLS